MIAKYERLRRPRRSKQGRLKALETFVPLNEEVKYIELKTIPRSLISDVIHNVTRRFAPYRRLKNIRGLHPRFSRDPSSISTIPEKLNRVVDEVGFNDPIFTTDDNRLEKTIITALEYLQREDLELHDRLWTLSVLQILQSLLPRGNLGPIREDPNTGSVCRGGLELFLLKGLDYKPRVKDVSNGRTTFFPVDTAVTEALKRVELIVNIKNYLRDAEKNLQTPTFIRIHDQLLRNDSLVKAGILESLATQLKHHVIIESTAYGEIECLYRIMKHLESFYPATKHFAMTEATKRVKLIMRIKFYLQDSKINHQIHKIMNIYNKLLQINSLDNAMNIKFLALQCLQHANLKPTSDKDIECLYHIFQYLDTLHPTSQSLAITEPLRRVELIMKIRSYLNSAQEGHQTPRITEIHNKLLQTSTDIEDGTIQSWTLQLLAYIVLDIGPDEELKCLSNILEYLKVCHPAGKLIVESWLSNSKPFKMIQDGLRCQAELQNHLQTYSQKANKDPYIMSLLLPFEERKLVDLAYVKQCLHILNIQDSALEMGIGATYGLDLETREKYHEDQDFFIEMMYKASPYIEGTQEYLDDHVEKYGKIGHYKFNRKVELLEDEVESFEGCAICHLAFQEGQRVAKLGCGDVPHMFHTQCLNSWILTSGGVEFQCPTCRKMTKTPLAQDEQLFWGSLKAHQNNL
ncbi:hypothetical protein DFH28DRAFT_1056805 [Melampsora americana]|nr:hypothetical protein DFH28DRAFT_1056805 [Melampsora americana]